MRKLHKEEGDIVKIKKQLKRENSRRKNIIIVSIIIMFIMPYVVMVLNDQEVFSGWEKYFAFSYVIIVDLMLFLNMIRLFSESVFQFEVTNQKVKIKDSLFKRSFTISLDKILYVDVLPRHKDDFEMLIIIDKGKRGKRFNIFDREYVKFNIQYKDIYNRILRLYPDKQFYSYSIKKAGAKKYYYLYTLFKNSYNSKFSEDAVEYIKRFMEEYDMA